eukprot:391223-Prorocentrum_lima.AAC.1
MTSSLVGSEMCIRDRNELSGAFQTQDERVEALPLPQLEPPASIILQSFHCLLYTSDAADDM